MDQRLNPNDYRSFTNFGDMLKYLRRRQRLTQLELSIAVGYSEAQISRLEQNQRLPDLTAIKALFIPALNLEHESQISAHFLELAQTARQEDLPTPGIAPYKGLLYYDESDSELFFGREALTSQLTRHVMDLTMDATTRLLAIVGASGSGKSSLGRAGLSVALQRAGWEARVFTPTANPLRMLEVNLKSAHTMKTERVLILVDQFEEVFTLCHDELERIAFIEKLLSCAQEKAGQFSVVITLRADFYSHCAQYPLLRQAVAAEQEYIGQMNKEELRRAIEEPAKLGGWEFEPGLVDLLLYDIGAQGTNEPEPGALPLLSHALLATWERRSGRKFTLDGYHASGGVHGAIAETAESVFTDQLNQAQQEITREVFLRLTDLGEGTEDTRRRASLNELVRQPEEAVQLRAVLNILAEARLITLNEDNAEVSHEALIREWQRLHEWLTQDRTGLLLHRHLTEAAQSWEGLGREPGELYRGARLTTAIEWYASHPDILNQLEVEFLAASKVLSEEEIAERQAARQREIEAARRIAETERHRAEEQAQAAKKFRWLATILAVLLVAAAILANFALEQRKQAQAAAIISQSRELAAAAITNLNVDPERSLMLALEAVKLGNTSEAVNALHQAVHASRIRRTLQVNEQEVVGTRYSKDGKQIATGSVDGIARVWDIASGEVLVSLDGHTDMINMVAYSADGDRLATASDDGAAKVWDAQTGKEIFTLSGHNGFVSGVAYSPDDQLLVTVDEEGKIRVWDAQAGELLRTFQGHSASILDLAFSPDGSRLVTASDDKTAVVWDTDTGQAIVTLAGHEDGLRGVAYSPDGQYIATASADVTARLWDATSGRELRVFTGHTNIVQGIAFSPDGSRLATGGYDGRVKIWSIPAGDELMSLSGRAVLIFRVAFSPDGLQVASANSDGSTQLWDVSPRKEYLTLTGHQEFVNSVLYSPDGNRLLTASDDGLAAIWDAQSGQVLNWLKGHQGAVIRAVFSPDGSRVATASDDLTARIWDSNSGEELYRFTGHLKGAASPPFSGVLDAAFDPSGIRLATAGSDAKILIWDIASKTQVMQLIGHTDRVNTVAFSPDGARLASGSDDKTIKIWDLSSGKAIMTLEGHTARVWRVVFSPDGTWLASSGTDSAVILWDAQTGKQLKMLSGHTSTVLSAAFSQQTGFLASASLDGSVKIWDAERGEELLTLSDPRTAATGVDFSPDGSLLAVSGDDGNVQVFFMRVEDLVPFARSRLTRWLTQAECLRFLHTENCPVMPGP
jgi:WD40 repeat protein/transcriptional regulator with XRE-family HTH domain